MKNRKPNRMPGYDYSSPGCYFITICVHGRVPAFGFIDGGGMVRNEYGEIAMRQWIWLGEQYNYIALDEFVVMPDHVHGIIVISDMPDDPFRVDESNRMDGLNRTGRSRPARTGNKIKPIHEIIGAYKTTTSKQIHIAGYHDFRWQRSFYDRIIRDRNELNAIRNYIKQNPFRYGMSR
jgi:putative transposase